jgi:2-keto-4-pentenoate hydratase/2-oxohepta-3-ene-1,7-dioic acid hydratase in catechol pathway
MRIANLKGRAVLVGDGKALDIERASDGRFGPAPLSIYEHWDAFTQWSLGVDLAAATPFDENELDAPVPNPSQVFAIGLNYRDHADEAKLAHPDDIVVFTKFASSLAGPNVAVELPSDKVDWETELVVVIAHEAHEISESQARSVIAGYAIGQDYSERAVQGRGPAPQFSFGKSYPNFAPFGPAVVTLDELDNPDALRIGAVLSGPSAAGHDDPWTIQDGTTADLIFSVTRIIADLSQVVTLRPGDIIFTGTPAGVGMARGVFLKPGDVVTSTIQGLGSMRNELVAKR